MEEMYTNFYWLISYAGTFRFLFPEFAYYSASLPAACFGVDSYSKFQHPFTPRKDGPFISVSSVLPKYPLPGYSNRPSKAFFKILCRNAAACCRLWVMFSSSLSATLRRDSMDRTMRSCSSGEQTGMG